MRPTLPRADRPYRWANPKEIESELSNGPGLIIPIVNKADFHCSQVKVPEPPPGRSSEAAEPSPVHSYYSLRKRTQYIDLTFHEENYPR
jgi:hypothetical protein